ncbi:hypothetical protein F2P56_012819 [Juglans regia]|uniref:Uncharacterized protein n=1 Tax=Juglans regia TaxID=51240 RepID=A0A833XNB7_JUGRE|nr:hypothetical protein F2P56_012819 [Juglans regia]
MSTRSTCSSTSQELSGSQVNQFCVQISAWTISGDNELRYGSITRPPVLNADSDSTVEIGMLNTSRAISHGSDECILNILEACAIDVLQNVNKHYALIYCFEFLAIEGRQKDWKSCFTTLGLPKKPVLDCYISGNGTKLVQKYADETARLNPPHTFVPWVVVNNHDID